MALHHCTRWKSAYSTLLELHDMETVRNSTLTWKCEFCKHEAQKMTNLKKHYTRFKRRNAKDTRLCQLSEASPFMRSIEQNKRKRGCPQPKEQPDQPIQSNEFPTQPSLAGLPKILKLKLNTR